MDNTKKIVIATIVCVLLALLPIGAGFLLFDRLPEQLPIHFNEEGVADGYAEKTTAIILVPVICAVLSLGLALILGKVIRYNFKAILAVITIGPLFSIGIQAALLCNALGFEISEASVAVLIIGLVCIVFGNLMPTVRPNGVFGIRFPWIMDDDDLWDRTQRMGGKLFLLLGIVLVFVSFAASEDIALKILMGGVLGVAVITGIYSYAISN